MAGKTGALAEEIEEIEQERGKALSPKEVRNMTIGELRGQGKSYKIIGKAVGLSKNQIGVILKDDKVKQRVEETQRYLASFLPVIRDEFMDLCLTGKDSIRLSAIKEYFASMGISPSHAPSVFINKLYQDNRQQILSPHVQAIVDGHLDDVIEGEIVE